MNNKYHLVGQLTNNKVTSVFRQSRENNARNFFKNLFSAARSCLCCPSSFALSIFFVIFFLNSSSFFLSFSATTARIFCLICSSLRLNSTFEVSHLKYYNICRNPIQRLTLKVFGLGLGAPTGGSQS